MPGFAMKLLGSAFDEESPLGGQGCVSLSTDSILILFSPKLLVEILMRPTLTMQKKKPKSKYP